MFLDLINLSLIRKEIMLKLIQNQNMVLDLKKEVL
nr:MAG TPA: hypothetical protein [Bacteriophage sp.]